MKEALPRCQGYPVVFERRLTFELARATGFFRPRILVSAAFFQLALPFQAAVLTHEVGHLKNGHFWKRLLMFLLPVVNLRAAARIARRHEIEADEYAARQGFGQALAMLYRSMDHMAKARGSGVPKENRLMQPGTEYRIRRIMRAVKEV